MQTHETHTQERTDEIIEAGDEGIVLGSPDWVGPFKETDKHGRLTGHAYVECPECGIEVLTGSKEHASHRPECPHYQG